MNFVAYNYFPPNNLEFVKGIADAISTSELALTHLGKNDPPKKWSGTTSDLAIMLQQGTEMTCYTFTKDTKANIQIDFALGNHPSAICSSISIGGESKELVERICMHFSNYVQSYLCISGNMGLGSQQHWSLLLQSEQCPKTLLEQINNI